MMFDSQFDTLFLATLGSVALVLLAAIALAGPRHRRKRADIERYMRRRHADTQRRRTIRALIFGDRRHKRISFQPGDRDPA